MKIKYFLIAFFIVLIPIAVVANEIKYQDEPTKEAANLVTKYALSDDNAERDNYLKQLEEMAEKNPSNNNVRNMYANILLAERKYFLGLHQLQLINKETPKPGSKLTECMLLERTGKDAGDCYREAVSLFEKNNENDDNYVMALYLSNNPKFEAKKNELMKKGKLENEGENIFSLNRNELINSIFP
ncbi:hypothetical protein [Enterobacillus tribolii]|uniref:Tetratricopeptide repeat protein n=1 Tax=Enterobacillus tribolii TaxID=1487935 RepID=A0A370R1D9_9GAMM|nr:hypothetical protein [Enterobacillus tribolii]MBW7982697.1 hypothetical protein [Enterobacillus tribolii]RDK95742.1 hypothetical protein C8D90_102223 [Enterobacillus tribolii]